MSNLELPTTVKNDNRALKNKPKPKPEEKETKKVRQTIDFSILVAVIIIICYGLIMVFSASYYTAENTEWADSTSYYFEKQLVGAIIGTAAMIFLMNFDYHKLARFKWIFLIIAFGFLIAIFIPGVGFEINGSTRWINLRFTTLQPSEVMKFSLIIFLSATIAKNPNRIRHFFSGLVPYLLLLGVIAGLIMLQPNLSAVVCIALLFFVILIVAGCNLKHMGGIACVGVFGIIGLMFSSSYRAERVQSFLNPFAYSSDEGYQVVQSLYAFGGGGLFGRGLGNSIQKQLFLPYSESDFILAILAEELGFIGVLFLFALFIFFIWRGIRVAMAAPDMLGMLMATGVTAIIAIQVLVNVSVVTGTLPPTGVALPFISYGSSGLIIFMAMVGILLNVSRQVKKA